MIVQNDCKLLFAYKYRVCGYLHTNIEYHVT